MNKEKLIANWDDLKAETKARILALADKEIKEDYFVPKEGEKCYSYAYNYKEIIPCVMRYDNIEYCENHLQTGNLFRTIREATFAGNCEYYTKRFETYVNRHSEKLGWNDNRQYNFYVYYSYVKDKIFCDHAAFYKTQGTTYASSEQILKDAIFDIGEENFLKYVMKVDK